MNPDEPARPGPRRKCDQLKHRMRAAAVPSQQLLLLVVVAMMGLELLLLPTLAEDLKDSTCRAFTKSLSLEALEYAGLCPRFDAVMRERQIPLDHITVLDRGLLPHAPTIAPQPNDMYNEALPVYQRDRVAVLIPWIRESLGGRLRRFNFRSSNWLPLFLASVRTNDAFADWLVFYDPVQDSDGMVQGLWQHACQTNPPPNLKCFPFNLTEMAQLYESRLGIKAAISGNNLKGMKPVLGFIFEDYIKSYSHWAWSDVDVVYGDLSRILSCPMHSFEKRVNASNTSLLVNEETRMVKKRFITVMPQREHWCYSGAIFAGQMTIFTNENATNRFVLDQMDDRWKKDYRSPYFTSMDEKTFPKRVVEVFPDDILFVESQLTLQGTTAAGQDLDSSHAVLVWLPEGRLLALNQSSKEVLSEAALLHFSTVKRFDAIVNISTSSAIHGREAASADLLAEEVRTFGVLMPISIGDPPKPPFERWRIFEGDRVFKRSIYSYWEKDSWIRKLVPRPRWLNTSMSSSMSGRR